MTKRKPKYILNDCLGSLDSLGRYCIYVCDINKVTSYFGADCIDLVEGNVFVYYYSLDWFCNHITQRSLLGFGKRKCREKIMFYSKDELSEYLLNLRLVEELKK